MNRISFLNRGYAFKGLLAVMYFKMNKLTTARRIDEPLIKALLHVCLVV